MEKKINMTETLLTPEKIEDKGADEKGIKSKNKNFVDEIKAVTASGKMETTRKEVTGKTSDEEAKSDVDKKNKIEPEITRGYDNLLKSVEIKNRIESMQAKLNEFKRKIKETKSKEERNKIKKRIVILQTAVGRGERDLLELDGSTKEVVKNLTEREIVNFSDDFEKYDGPQTEVALKRSIAGNKLKIEKLKKQKKDEKNKDKKKQIQDEIESIKGKIADLKDKSKELNKEKTDEDIEEIQKKDLIYEGEKELKRLSPKDKVTFFQGIADIGYRTTEFKSRCLGKAYSFIGDKVKEKKVLHNFFKQYTKYYQKREDFVKKQRETRNKGAKAKSFGALQGAGNFLRAGRVVYDFKRINPFRHVTAAAMTAGHAFEMAKETRLDAESVKEKTRITDKEEAMEEAWKIYNEVFEKNGNKKISASDLEQSYRKFLPKDIIKRIEKLNINGTRFYQHLLEKDAQGKAERLIKQIDKIQNNQKLSKEKRRQKIENFLHRKSALFKDLDAMVSRAGQADAIAYWTRISEQISKGTAKALMIDSLARLVKAGADYSGFSERFFNDKEAVESEKGEVITKSAVPPESQRQFEKGLSEIKKMDSDGEELEAVVRPEPKVAPGDSTKPAIRAIETESAVGPHPKPGTVSEQSAPLSTPDAQKEPADLVAKAEITPQQSEDDHLKNAFNKIKEKVEDDKKIEAAIKEIRQAQFDKFKDEHSLLETSGAEIKLGEDKISVNYEIGKKGDFKYLDQALRRIVVDKMDFGADNKMDALEAARAENTLANLRELILGRNVAGMKAEDLKGIASFNEKTGEFKINDYTEFEKNLGGLLKHAKEIINADSGALAYTDDTSQKNWQEMLGQKAGKAGSIQAEDFKTDKLVTAAEEKLKPGQDFGGDVIDLSEKEKNFEEDVIDLTSGSEYRISKDASLELWQDVKENILDKRVIKVDDIEKAGIDADNLTNENLSQIKWWSEHIKGVGSGEKAGRIFEIADSSQMINNDDVLNSYDTIQDISNTKLQANMVELLERPDQASATELLKNSGINAGERLRKVIPVPRNDGNLQLHYDIKWAPDFDVIITRAGKAYIDGPMGWDKSFDSLKNLPDILKWPLDALKRMEK
ncbi:MAG: hypothetical protein U9R06_01175 [Patescibacteria group bacterium]|nr:hypothetical protein [Patescibacteria group bacterium]